MTAANRLFDTHIESWMNLPGLTLHRVTQVLPTPVVDDLAAAVRREVGSLRLPARLPPGAKVAVTAGSRGITNIARILALAVAELKAEGFAPFLVPAMGSHGGATGEGQKELLARIGITEEVVGAPIRSSMDVVEVGKDSRGVPVYADRTAWTEADGILVVNRVKPHTEFSGSIASGLLKMLVIGLGKHRGALTAHKQTLSRTYMGTLPEMGRVILAGGHVVGGLAIVENYREETHSVHGVMPADFEAADTRLAALSTSLLGRLPFEDLDVLVVDWAGKEISGNGIDPNVIGRRMFIGEPEPTSPKIRRLFLRDLTPITHGNALGIGLADFCTRRAAEQVDFYTTYTNAITAMIPEKGRLPVVCEHDRQGVEWSILTGSPELDPALVRLAWIKNTRDLETFYISPVLLREISGRRDLTTDSQATQVTFDPSTGNAVPFWKD